MYSAIAAATHKRPEDEEDGEKEENSCTSNGTEAMHRIFQQEYIIMAEYKKLQTENLHGVYVIPSHENSFLWFGVIIVRCGIYEGGVFRFNLILPDSFPDCDCPSVTFQSQVYHPAVDPETGVLNLSEAFPKWTKSVNHVWQILKYVHWIFQNPNTKVPLNSEALKQYKTNRTAFSEKAKESVLLSIEHQYDEPPNDDKHYICFSPYDPNLHDSVRASMLNPTDSLSLSQNQGLSWVQPGTFRPFTKMDQNVKADR